MSCGRCGSHISAPCRTRDRRGPRLASSIDFSAFSSRRDSLSRSRTDSWGNFPPLNGSCAPLVGDRSPSSGYRGSCMEAVVCHTEEVLEA
ncbi:hypothetical protein A1O3_07644 [Capronia epimyces CBS 606.96]|uniref:Uncharacterized protein n=1 Tax=Capronia epimyces CBS 606.96 TaxID=1182542 RepID=W9YGG1_9EURO|nr:uncharacterized protein A1O3_07644 [Capronia epimyces CBS 606.96]EXJ81354.1 hypothetical protein A1O3_07644 [Capronia epimyces CBS 606.96]